MERTLATAATVVFSMGIGAMLQAGIPMCLRPKVALQAAHLEESTVARSFKLARVTLSCTQFVFGAYKNEPWLLDAIGCCARDDDHNELGCNLEMRGLRRWVLIP